MPKTVNTSATSYLPALEFLKRTDVRKVCQLVSDASVAVDSSTVATNANLLAALLDASGEFEAAVLIGNKYQPADIAALTGSTLSFVYRVLTVISWNHLIDRRVDLNLPEHPRTPWAEGVLQALKLGERILSFTETQEAGLLDHQVTTEADIINRNGMTHQARRYFGARAADWQ